MIIQRLIRKTLCGLSLLSARHYIENGKANKEFLLTFDDGPHPQWTPELLDFLKENDIRGVFFVIGENVLKYPEIVQRVVDDGHILGNHTLSHKDISQLRIGEYIKHYEECESLLRGYSGFDNSIPFRPPRGLLGIHSLLYFLRNKIKVMLWTIDSGDSEFLSVDNILKIISSSKNNKEIILFHDDSSLVIDVLKKGIPIWRDNGIFLAPLYR